MTITAAIIKWREYTHFHGKFEMKLREIEEARDIRERGSSWVGARRRRGGNKRESWLLLF